MLDVSHFECQLGMLVIVGQPCLKSGELSSGTFGMGEKRLRAVTHRRQPQKPLCVFHSALVVRSGPIGHRYCENWRLKFINCARDK